MVRSFCFICAINSDVLPLATEQPSDYGLLFRLPNLLRKYLQNAIGEVATGAELNLKYE